MNKLKELFNESGILYRAGVKKYGKEGMRKIQQAAGKRLGHEEIGKIKDKYEKEAFDRKFGESLPTLKDTMEKHTGRTLTEKKELGGALINKIERLTDKNNHNEARLELAKQMKLKNLVKAYEALMVLHDTFNQMNELMHAREKLDKDLFKQAKKMYSDYDSIEGAF